MGMQNKHVRTFGYGAVIKSGQTARQQKNAFAKAGVKDVFIDDGGSDEFTWLMQDHAILGMQADDILMLVCEAYLGYPGRTRDARLRKLTERGVLVGVIGEDPMLYDTEEKIKHFLERSRTVSVKDRMKKLGAGPGKPSKAALKQDQWDILVYFWQNTRAPRMAFIQIIQDLSKANGKPCVVDDNNLSDWLGRREPGEVKPPKGLILCDFAT